MVQYWFMMVLKNYFDLAHELRARIERGEWPQGGRLPPERQMAEELQVARNTLRRALDLLERKGYLTREVGRGTFVRAAADQRDDLLVVRMGSASPRDILETRLIIEPRTAALAAVRASAADLAAISQAFNQSLAAEDLAAFEHWDTQLHLAIFIAAKNELLIDYCRAISEVRNQPHWFQLKQKSATAERRAVYHSQHRSIVRALLDRNAELASEAMREHLRTVEENILAVA